MIFFKTSDKIIKLKVCFKLTENHPNVQNNDLFLQSIPFILANDLYQVFYVTPNENGFQNSNCYGIIKIYQIPLIENHVIGIESVFIQEKSFKTFVFALTHIAALPEKMNLFGVFFNQISLNADLHIEDTLRLKFINNCPVRFDKICLQGALKGIYSPFIEQPMESAFFSEGLIINTFKIKIEFSGVLTKKEILYRGEGRLDNSPFWKFDRIEDLVNYFFISGFESRLAGVFNGSLPEQIQQQGYVNQPTVSLTDSKKVATFYATNGNNRNVAIIFEIDIHRLSMLGDTFDSYKTMKKYCNWLLPNTFEAILKIVHTLDVKQAGEFLNKLDMEAQKRVHLFGGGSLGEEINWDDFFNKENYSSLIVNGLTDKLFRQIQDEFELFWNIANSGGIFSAKIILDDAGEEISAHKDILKPNYHRAFKIVEDNLINAFSRNSKFGEIGWDLSPFGYIAKTIRDKEFFSPTSIPGHCIIRAEIVNSNGEVIQEIKNDNSASNKG